MTPLDVFANAKSLPVLSALHALIDANLSGATAASSSKPKPNISWSTPVVRGFIGLSEDRGSALVFLNVHAVRDGALAPRFAELKAFHDGGNCLRFKAIPDPWPPAFVTLVRSMLPVLEPFYEALNAEIAKEAAASNASSAKKGPGAKSTTKSAKSSPKRPKSAKSPPKKGR